VSVTAGCRTGLGGLCSSELSPKRFCELILSDRVCLTGTVLQGLDRKDHNSRFLSIGVWVKGIGELQRVCLGNHGMFNLGYNVCLHFIANVYEPERYFTRLGCSFS